MPHVSFIKNSRGTYVYQILFFYGNKFLNFAKIKIMNNEILIILGVGTIVYFLVLGMFAVLKKWSDENDDE